MFLIVVS